MMALESRDRVSCGYHELARHSLHHIALAGLSPLL
jgi:hypothetical protein